MWVVQIIPSPGTISPPKPREAQGHNRRQGGTHNEGSKGRAPCPGSYQGCTSKASAPVSRCETCHHWSWGAALWVTFWTKDGCCLGMGHIMGCRARTFLGLHRFYYRVLKGELKGKKKEGI